MLSDTSKQMLLKKMQKIMKKNKMTLREIIDITRESADYLETILVESENH